MTQLAKYEAGAANFALNGAGWSTVSYADASGGSYSTNTTSGRTATITTPANTTTALLGYTARPDAPTNVTYQVDSGPVVTLNMQNGAGFTNDAELYWYRCLSPPIPVTNDGGTHTLTVTCGTGTTGLDFVECYGASAATAAKMITFGHSIAYGYSPGGAGDPASPQPGRFSALIAPILGCDDTHNFGTPSEDLTNGGVVSGNTQYYNQTAVTTPGWVRAETGTNWWSATPRHALVMHGLNDAGYPAIYDAGFAVPLANRDGSGHTTCPAAGTGYAVARYKQRFLELLWRMNANVPTCQIWVAGICACPNTSNANPAIVAVWQTFNATMYACCTAATVTSAAFIGTYGATVGGAFGTQGAYLCSDNAHPNTAGHRAIATEIAKKLEGALRPTNAFPGVR